MEGRTTLAVRFVAHTPEQREKGLMFAEPLDEREAALFVFPYSERYAFWNKNVSFPLSLAFLDENRRVVDMADMEAQSTESVAPCGPARYVVEARKGTFAQMGVQKGDLIDYRDHTLHLVRIASKAI